MNAFYSFIVLFWTTVTLPCSVERLHHHPALPLLSPSPSVLLRCLSLAVSQTDNASAKNGLASFLSSCAAFCLGEQGEWAALPHSRHEPQGPRRLKPTKRAVLGPSPPVHIPSSSPPPATLGCQITVGCRWINNLPPRFLFLSFYAPILTFLSVHLSSESVYLQVRCTVDEKSCSIT